MNLFFSSTTSHPSTEDAAENPTLLEDPISRLRPLIVSLYPTKNTRAIDICLILLSKQKTPLEKIDRSSINSIVKASSILASFEEEWNKPLRTVEAATHYIHKLLSLIRDNPEINPIITDRYLTDFFSKEHCLAQSLNFSATAFVSASGSMSLITTCVIMNYIELSLLFFKASIMPYVELPSDIFLLKMSEVGTKDAPSLHKFAELTMISGSIFNQIQLNNNTPIPDMSLHRQLQKYLQDVQSLLLSILSRAPSREFEEIFLDNFARY